MNQTQMKRRVAQILISQAGNLVEFWDSMGDEDIDAEFARECLARWMDRLPGDVWDIRLDDPTRPEQPTEAAPEPTAEPEAEAQPAPVACTHGHTPRPDVTGDPVAACAASSGVTFGAFNAEGAWYAGDCAVDVANEVAQETEEEGAAEDPDSTWGAMCREHEGEPASGCEECSAEPAEDKDEPCEDCDGDGCPSCKWTGKESEAA